MMHFSVSVLLTTALLTVPVFASESLNSGANVDRQLHESAIPPLRKQPKQEVIIEMLTKVFTKIDTNGDKQVDAPELKSWLDSMHKSTIEENVLRQWHYYFPEGDNETESSRNLSWKQYTTRAYPLEVLQFVNGSKVVKSDIPHFDEYLNMHKRAVRKWAAADRNNDSVLVKEEFTYFLYPGESPETNHVLVDETMESIDTDASGQVTPKEYFKYVSESTDESQKQNPAFWESYEHHFKHLDQDKNGALNSTELSRWIIPQYDPHEAEADRLISDGDTNSDRLLSNEEIAKNSGHFHTLIPAKFWKRYWDDGGVFAHDEF